MRYHNELLILDEKDNVGVVTQGELKGHKLSLKAIASGERIIKYGYPIGYATQNINSGELVHTGNTKTTLSGILDYVYEPDLNPLESVVDDKSFNGYVRKNGEVGIRNELWIIPTVGCVNGIGRYMVNAFTKLHEISENYDGIHIFEHQYGCSQLGEDHEQTKKLLQNMAKHPNAGGVLVLGLGCENNQINAFKDTLGTYDEARIQFMICQEHQNELEDGLKILESLYEKMIQDQRVALPLKHLKVGLECGGSDAYSGITANPLIGMFSDYLISRGGTTVLTEVPEMFGAEVPLLNRCKDEATFNKAVEMINNFKHYFMKHDQPIYENPSPGNKAGGITTLEEKSLGCTKKSGVSPVNSVLFYNERIEETGLSLLESPGNDIVATTALGASGCQLVLFSTGRGTPYGGFIPTMKISTNEKLGTEKKHWIDFDASQVLNQPIEKVFEAFVDGIISIANGQLTKHEILGIRDIGVFKKGVTL